ncbi:MAG: hypothetical protein Fues2KO_37430 [Fuerstiella sp.]
MMNALAMNPASTRRDLLKGLTAATLSAAAFPYGVLAATADRSPLIATNTYPWSTFARRDGQSLTLHTDELLKQISSTGINGYEPIINSPDEFQGLKQRLQQHSLVMKSLYVNSVLHDPAQVDGSSAAVLAIAREAKSLGTEIIVTNPSPIRWGGTEDKTDRQLRIQADALNQLGQELRKLGLTLAYHNHDAELRQGAREFHHMLTATDAQNVRFCLDAHWVFRGCGDSEVAVMDALKHYDDRVVELHLRQSLDGIWTEVFAMNGDIDYRRIFDHLRTEGIQPHYVLEQSIEAASPHKLSVVDAHRISCRNLKKALA